MTAPLVVLAVLSVVGGGMQLPFSKSTHWLEHWLAPVVHGAEADIKGTWAYDNKWSLLALAIVIAAAGIAASIAVYSKGKAKPVEPALLSDGWRYDATVSAVVGGPGRAAFQAVADVDAKVVDGAVVGTGRLVLAISSLVRRAQTGFVRSYAAIIGAASVLVLAWFLWRGWL